ncbi:MAG: hypothetical protein V1765_00460 [bacterium]
MAIVVTVVGAIFIALGIYGLKRGLFGGVDHNLFVAEYFFFGLLAVIIGIILVALAVYCANYLWHIFSGVLLIIGLTIMYFKRQSYWQARRNLPTI